jgi:hypothetical protein
MSYTRHRHKGNRAERAIVTLGRDRGFTVKRDPLSGSVRALSSATLPLLGKNPASRCSYVSPGMTDQASSHLATSARRPHVAVTTRTAIYGA